ncbi:hypothetical protein HZA56_18475, partial [Candidatus Poribacteria bacterium]|nr:hypothetical protein [Candidatus Poribacteria bacterium]
MPSGTREKTKIHIYSPFANALADHIRKRFPDSEIVTIWGKEEFEKHADEIEVLLCFRPPKELLAQSPRISWIMSVGAGVDSILPNPGLRKECVVTNARGIHAAQISEYV